MRKPHLEGLTFERMDFPADINVETCAWCNLKCPMCPYPQLKRAKGEMPEEVFAKIVDEVVDERPDARIWIPIMGEPLLGKRLIPMLSYARDRGFRNLHMNTNATLLDETRSRELLACDLKEISMSLDAATEATYRRIRVGGDFSRAVANAERLIRLRDDMGLERPRITIQLIVMPENENEIEAFKEYWLARGGVVKIRLKVGWGGAVPSEALAAANVVRDFPCPRLLRSVHILWDGKFAQCDADFEGRLSPGSIHENSIREVWQGRLAKRREQHWRLDFRNPLCRECRDWGMGRSETYYPEPQSKGAPPK